MREESERGETERERERERESERERVRWIRSLCGGKKSPLFVSG